MTGIERSDLQIFVRTDLEDEPAVNTADTPNDTDKLETAAQILRDKGFRERLVELKAAAEAGDETASIEADRLRSALLKLSKATGELLAPAPSQIEPGGTDAIGMTVIGGTWVGGQLMPLGTVQAPPIQPN